MSVDLDKVIKSARRGPLFVDEETTRAVSFGREEICKLLPHRDPFLFVDRISAVDLTQESARGHRRIDPDDPVFAGHFPGNPVYPGALQVETMGQLAVCLHNLLVWERVELRPDDEPEPVRLLRVQQGLFLAEARPGDELEILARRLEADSFAVTCAAQVLKGDTICSCAIMEVFLPDT